MKLIVIGGVAGGATAAARARRIDEHAEIIVLERGDYISFANCGLPYYIGSVIEKRENLLVTTADDFHSRYGIDVRITSEVVGIDRKAKTVRVIEKRSGKQYLESYDKIILSPGAEPVIPPIPGIDSDRIFHLRTIPDSDKIKEFIQTFKPKKAVVVGGGFIGLEMVENLVHVGLHVTLVEKLEQVMPPFDREMAEILKKHLVEKGVDCILGDGVRKFVSESDRILVETEKGKTIDCDMVFTAIGIRPETEIARQAGLETGKTGGVCVDATMRTSDPDIFAVGDAVETRHFITGMPTITALAGPANKQARIAADNAMGRRSLYKGSLGTSVLKLFDLTAASTGAGEKQLVKAGIPYRKSYTWSASHASYYPNPEDMIIKMLFSPADGNVLGAQIIGGSGVDKRIDVIATAIRGGMSVFDLEELELAYAPPYSSAKDPVNISGFVASNMLKTDCECIHWDELQNLEEKHIIIDLRESIEIRKYGAIPDSVHVPLHMLRNRLSELDRDTLYILYCAVGLRGYLAHRIMAANGFRSVNLNGGYFTWENTSRDS